MSSDEEDNEDPTPYEVGYGLPPVKHRWVKGGPSPNPRGRPPGARDRRSITRKVAEEARSYTEGGRRKRSTNFELVIMTVRNGAAKGDLNAIALYDWLEGQHRTDDPIPKAVLIVGETLTDEEWEAKYAYLADR